MAKLKFEDSMQKLEEIVALLEKGDLTLEESVANYESGFKIYKQCVTLLKGVEKKIKVLTKTDDGELQEKDITMENSV